MVKCKICGKEFDKNLSKHITTTHHISTKDYYDTYLKRDGEGTCEVESCNNQTKFISLDIGYSCGCCKSHKSIIAYSKLSSERKALREQRRRTTCVEKYGSVFSPKAFTNDALEKRSESYKNTCIEKYGSTNYFSSNEGSKKIADIKVEKYGCPYYNGIDKYKDDPDKMAEIKRKEIETKKRNGTVSTSKQEDNFYKFLLTIFDREDIIRQYRDDRYPFYCDFYIKSKDLFIECNFHWTHGGRPFTGSEQDLTKLSRWNLKKTDSEYINNAIYTWTVRDVNKFNAAKVNNLNYVAYYTYREAIDEITRIMK